MRGGTFDMFFDVESRSVTKLMDKLMWATSPPTVATFLHTVITPWLAQRARARFASEGDSMTGPWKDLAPSTVDIRARGEWPVGGEHPINRRTGEMEEYFAGGVDEFWAHPAGATLVYPKRTSKQSVVEKARTAQQGRNNPATPPRPVIGLDEKDLGFVMSQLQFMVRGWAR